jgi:ribonuclease/clavin/mitogillin
MCVHVPYRRSHHTLTLLDRVQVTPLVTRILGQNPGPYTLGGTNTYLLQAREPSTAILLDAGQDFEDYLPLLKKAFYDKGYKKISDIIITHYHHDHVLGLTSVLKWLETDKLHMPKIHKFPCIGKSEYNDQVMLDILKEHSAYSSKRPFEALTDGQVFPLATNATLRVISTPGHTEDSASFLLEGTDTPLIFTADTVLGRGTAVFVDLKALVTSLHRMIDEAQKMRKNESDVKLLCGHGPVIEDGIAKMKEYIEHRMDRERQVLDALRKASKPQTAAE